MEDLRAKEKSWEAVLEKRTVCEDAVARFRKLRVYGDDAYGHRVAREVIDSLLAFLDASDEHYARHPFKPLTLASFNPFVVTAFDIRETTGEKNE